MQAKIKIFAFWENPTCVGKTRSTSSSDKEQGQGHPHMRGEDSRFHKRVHEEQEHPHIRGEDKTAQLIALLCKGTSPHAWGRL